MCELSADPGRQQETSYPVDLGGIRINVLVVIRDLLQKEAVGFLYHRRKGLHRSVLLQETQFCRCIERQLVTVYELLIFSPLGLLLKVFKKFVA